MALIQTLAPDPGADIAAQAQLMRQQKLAQLLANPPKAPEIDFGPTPGSGDKGGSPEGNSILAKMLSEDVSKTAGPSVASFDAPVSTGSQPTYSFTGGAGKSGLDPVANAQSLLGKEEHVDHDDIQNYLKTGGIGMDPAKVAWCAAFVNASLAKSGIPGTNSAAALSFSKWGQPVRDGYQRGDVMVFDRGGGHGHVGLLTGNTRNGLVEMISGNQGNRVSTSWENPASAMIRRYVEQNQQGAALTPQAPAAAESPYQVASLGFTAPPRRQPVAPMQPAPQPAPAPATQTPPLPTMVGAPMPVNATPIGATGGAALTDAPMPPSRSASGVDEIIKRQAASARPALNAPQEFDLFDEIGRGLEELFGGGGGDAGGQSEGVQVAGGGEQYYPMQPTTGHGLLGNLLTDAFRSPVPIPSEVQALARSPKQSDRLAYQLMVHGNELGGTQAAMMTALYKEARDREQAGENRFGAPRMDQYGNLVQEGPNGQLHILQQAERPQGPIHVGNTLLDPRTYQPIYTAPKDPPQPPASVQEYEYVKQHPEAADYFNKTRVPDTQNTAEIKNFKYAQQNPDFAKSLQRGPSLTPDAITFYGEQVARGDTSPLQNLGRGAQGAENITAIRNAAVAYALKNGMDPRAIMDASAGYLGEKAASRTIGTNEANAVNAGVEAMNALKLGRETNAKLPRGQFYPVNKAIQAYQFGTSDPTLAAYGQAVATIANTYARAVNPKGLPHEAVVSDTLRRLNAAQGPDALNAIFDIMQKEIEMAQKAPAQARDVLKSNREELKKPSGTLSNGLPWSVEE